MRTVIARIFDYSLDGVIATEDTPCFDFCRELPDDPAQEDRNRALYASADLHVIGRVAYQGMAGYFPTATRSGGAATAPSSPVGHPVQERDRGDHLPTDSLSRAL